MRHEINLFDPTLRKPRVFLPSGQVAAGWMTFAFLLLAVYGWQAYSWQRLQQEQRAAGAALSALQEEVKKVSQSLSARKPSPEASARVEESEAGLQARSQVLERLRRGDLGSRDGHSALLQSLARNAVPGLWLTAITVKGAGSDVLLVGRTADPALLPEYLARLGKDAPLQGHAFNALEVTRPLEEDAAPAAGPRPAAPRPAAFLEFRVASRPGETAAGGTR